MRLFVPPPARTAYFSSTRRPGVVLRVSSTVALVPASSSAHLRVCVATPDIRQSRLSAVRSAVSRDRVGPVTTARTSPRATRAPSSTRWSNSAVPPEVAAKTRAATGRLATTPGARATSSAVSTWSAGIVASLVTSRGGSPRSSASAV
nr:hypothetical protein GCM10020092_006490 [Actinoplanes digitatis]